MGNCIDRQQAVSWVDDYDEDWGSEESVSPATSDNNKSKYPKMPSTSTGEEGVPPTEVKIKITKKQLETLLKQVDGQDLTVQDLLADLMVGGGTRSEEDAGWRPALQSIPEVSEQQQ